MNTDLVETTKNLGINKTIKMLLPKISETGIYQNYPTPIDLCDSILAKCDEVSPLQGRIGVFFNLEFLHALLVIRNVDPETITFVSDSKEKSAAATRLFGVKDIRSVKTFSGGRIEVMSKLSGKFDFIVMNPPYQPPVKKKIGGSGSSNVLWDKFVAFGIDALTPGGYLAAIHPNKWRKPDDKMFKTLASNNMLHLEMYSKKDGIKTFGAQTPYDWYVLQKAKYGGKTSIRDYNGQKQIIDLREFNFLPNCDLSVIHNLLAKPHEPKCEVLYSRTVTATDQRWVQAKETKQFCHPCVHTTGKRGVRYCYSSKREGFFDIPKVIFGDGDVICNAVVDFAGKYSMTQHAIGIRIKSQEEGDQIKKALESEKFNALLQNALRFSQFMIDWRVFTVLRKDFWKDFI